jgi:membrane protein DedA with SNARE-associated domain
VLIEQIGLPVPAIPTLVVAGALSVTGKLAIVELFAVALVACVIADSLWYIAGRVYGSRVMKGLCSDIVLYCTCPNEASAAQVAKLLMDRGYRRVRPLQGGLDAWVAAGYRIESVKVLV